jgi:putative flippase GtrA
MNLTQRKPPKYINPEFARFALIGLFNTALSYVLFAIFSSFIHYNIAYTLVYVVGIFISYALNAQFSFRTTMHWKTLLAYPLVYVFQYGAGILLLPILIGTLGIDRLIAAPIVIVATLPISFLASRLIIKRGGKS